VGRGGARAGGLAFTLRSRQVWQAIEARWNVPVDDEVLGRSTIGTLIERGQEELNKHRLLAGRDGGKMHSPAPRGRRLRGMGARRPGVAPKLALGRPPNPPGAGSGDADELGQEPPCTIPASA
jgi:hypothetical protein